MLAIAALGMDNRVSFNDEFLIKNGGLGRQFCGGFFWFSTGGLAILAGEAFAPRSAHETSSVAFAVALEAVRVLAIAALGMDHYKSFSDRFLRCGRKGFAMLQSRLLCLLFCLRFW